MKNFKEVYKAIDGFPNYEVSNLGHIRQAKSKRILKVKIDRYGYAQVGLYQDGKQHWKTVHRLVAIAFIPNPLNKREINHISADPLTKLNNAITNLEWVTRKENMVDASAKGLCGRKKVLADEQVEWVRANYIPKDKEFGQSAMSRTLGVSQSLIWSIINETRAYAPKVAPFVTAPKLTA